MAKKDKQKKGKNTQPDVGMNMNTAGVVPPVAGMNSTGIYPPPMGGVNSTGMFPPPVGGVNSTGMYPPPMGGVNSTGMFPPPVGGVNSTGMYPNTVVGQQTFTQQSFSTGVVGAAPSPAAADGKGKKAKGEKKSKGSKKNKNAVSRNVDVSKFNAEQMAQYQLDEALKESFDPSSRLRKLKSPLSVGGCLLMLAIFALVTTLVVFIVCWIMVDKFNPITIAADMLEKFGISPFFRWLFGRIKSLFGGGETIRALLTMLKF